MSEDKFDKEYEVSINTKVIFDFKNRKIPDIQDLMLGIAKVLTEKGWYDKRWREEGDEE